MNFEDIGTLNFDEVSHDYSQPSLFTGNDDIGLHKEAYDAYFGEPISPSSKANLGH